MYAFNYHAPKTVRQAATLLAKNADGKVLPYDAQQLLGVQKQQLVVVKGKVRQDASGYWLIA